MIKKSYKRLLEISDDYQQVTMPDSRYYRRNGKYYPSVTHVLSTYPKGKYFEDWLNGKEIKFLYDNGNPKMPAHVWQMFLRFVDFWETYKPQLIEAEVHLFSDKLEVAGTCDLVCEIEIDGKTERWIIDFKTSNHLQTTYDLQGALYAQCYEECYGKDIDRVAVLWLKSKSRGPDKNGKKIKGKNWEIYESPRTQEKNLEIFGHVKALFDLENPKPTPYTSTFKTVSQINVDS